MNGKTLRESLATIGVIASLAFVGTEIRQNNQLAEAAAYQELGIATADDWLEVALSPELNSLYWERIRAGDDPAWWATLTQAERDQMASVLVSTFRMFENVYRQVELGLLPPEALQTMGWTTTIQDGPPTIWPDLRPFMDSTFIAFIEGAWGI